MRRKQKTAALVDALCLTMVLLNDYVAAQGPIFDAPDAERDVRPVVRDAQAALRAVGGPGTKAEIYRHVARLDARHGREALIDRVTAAAKIRYATVLSALKDM